jgi:hypothetical protein
LVDETAAPLLLCPEKAKMWSILFVIKKII